MRDAADKDLTKVKTKLHNFVKAAFQGNEEMLIEFGMIPKGRGGKGKTDIPPDNTPPPPVS